MANGNKAGGKPNQDRMVAALVLGALGVAFAVFFTANPSKRVNAMVGKPIPPIAFYTAGGDQVSLASFRGMPLLINFWASWCGPCMQEMPDLATLEGKLSGRLKVLAFNIDETEQEFLKLRPNSRFPKHLIFRFDKSQLEPYQIHGIPVSYLVGADGLVKRVYPGPFRWVRPDMVRQIETLIR